jgi:4-amino-4-deoxy-L-arabinose transferase-like glycosyltransferase
MIALLAAAAMGMSFYYGITTGNDFYQHFQFAQSIRDSIVSGEIYPSFSASPNFGLGDIALRFYPPLGYYLLAFAFLISGSWYYAGQAVFWLVFFAGGLGVYLLAREEFSAEHSLLAAGLYIFVPYHLNEIYNNFLFAEFVATAVLPFCFLYITRICRGGGIGPVLGLGVSYALLVLSHLPLTVLGSIAFLLYGLLLLKKENMVRQLFALSGSVFIGLVLSSFYWVRMVREMEWVKHSQAAYFADTFSFGRNFLLKPTNWTNFQDDVLSLWFADMMLAAVVLLVVPTIVQFIRDRGSLSKATKALGALFLFSVFMTTPLSGFLWSLLPFLQKVQFPWRWMAIISVTGAVFAVPGIVSAAEAMKRSRNVLIPAGLGLVLLGFAFMAAFVVKQAVFVPKDDFEKQSASIGGSPSYEGWWPVWAQTPALARKEGVTVPGRQWSIEYWNPADRRDRGILLSALECGGE